MDEILYQHVPSLDLADFLNTRIQKFDSTGKFWQKWDTEPPAGPASVVVDQHGNAFVDNFRPHAHYV